MVLREKEEASRTSKFRLKYSHFRMFLAQLLVHPQLYMIYHTFDLVAEYTIDRRFNIEGHDV
jgi:hypothetical protein